MQPLHLYICHHQHPSKRTRRRKPRAVLARVVSNGHEYFISDFHVSSPWRQDYFYLPPPKWNGAQLSMFFCCCCIWRNRRQLRADAHMLWPEPWRRRNAIGRQVLLIRARFNGGIAVELGAGACGTLNPTLEHCSFRPRRAVLIIPRTHKHQMLLHWENLGHGHVQDEWMDPSSVGLDLPP